MAKDTATRLPFKARSRDLYCEVRCTCLDPRWEGTRVEGLIRTTVRLTGYDDAHFFETVNAEPREGACHGCGRRYRVQWFRDGVEFRWLEGPRKEADDG